MPKVSGSLKLVTGSPAAVSQVWLRAPHGRTQSGAYVTEAPDTIQVTGGAVSFDVLPGALVMTLVSHGGPMQTVKLLVPDKTSVTLAECIEAAELATDGARGALERLALEVQAELGQVPSLVSDALAQDATIIEAVEQASAETLETKADKTYVDEADQALGQRIDAEKAPLMHGHTTAQITDLHHYSGTGFPEGKVTAPVGATYTDTAATNGAIRWIKVSGTGSTGWRVEYGDTGWRDVSSALSSVLESGRVFFRRRGDTVDIVTEWAKFIPGGSGQMPAGFIPFRGDSVPLYASANLVTPVAQFRISYTGSITIYVFNNTYSANDQGTLTTADPWPTSLPGTPV